MIPADFPVFIPLPFQPGAGRFIEKRADPPGNPLRTGYFRGWCWTMFSHLKSYWPMTGLETGGGRIELGGG